MPERAVRNVHEWVAARFTAAFGETGDAILAARDGEVLICLGPLAQAIARVGSQLTDLPDGVTSPDLAGCLARLSASTMPTEVAHFELADGMTIAARILAMLSEDRVPKYIVAVLTEDTSFRELSRLRRHGRVYELLFERAPNGICLVALDGSFISANPAYCELVGRSERELQTLTFQDITHPDDLLLDVSLVEDVLARRIDRYDIDKRYILPSGSIVWVHLTVALLLDEHGAPQFFISMLEDITQRRAAQEQLQATMELWRTTFEQARVAMAELDLDGTIRRVNAAVGELLGGDAEQLVGRRVMDLGDPANVPVVTANLQQFASGEVKTSAAERRFRDRHGRTRWLSIHTAAVSGGDGQTDRLIMQVLDVTAERDLRERLQQSVDELSRAYREKSALMAAVSHDLRTPLAAIRILAELLASGDDSVTSTERVELAQRVLAEATRTERVLGDLVDSERASAGLITPRRVSLDFNELVRNVVEAETAHQNSHHVVWRPASSDCMVSVDPALVERMVANLLSNTFRHTRAGSTVWVSVDGGSAHDDGAVRLVVEDDGAGVPDALKEAVFEPFVRGTADRPGSGIGLFLVRRFVEFHGGTVTCTDRDGGGASFCVTLPAA